MFLIYLEKVIWFLKSPMLYLKDGKGNKWTRLDFIMLLVAISIILTFFFVAMHTVFGSINPH
jgi:hypothetical protein